MDKALVTISFTGISMGRSVVSAHAKEGVVVAMDNEHGVAKRIAFETTTITIFILTRNFGRTIVGGI